MKKGPDSQQIRKPAVAGTFYPSDETVLRNTICEFLDQVPPQHISGNIIALIAPHAGYMYSGQTAAYAYNLIQGQPFKKVVVIAPSHHAYFDGASVFSQGAFQTPLGPIPVDSQMAQDLLKSDSLISFMPEAHTREHSLEVQLPFLQVVLSSFSIVPIVMGSQDFSTCETLSRCLFPLLQNHETLIVASSDLSHFHYYDEARRQDNHVNEFISQFDPRGLSRALSEGSCEACGGGPIICTMLLSKFLGAQRTQVLHYTNSGDVTGDRESVVGYASAVILK
jgi:AmmeMemoRadiSam system protein B